MSYVFCRSTHMYWQINSADGIYPSPFADTKTVGCGIFDSDVHVFIGPPLIYAGVALGTRPDGKTAVVSILVVSTCGSLGLTPPPSPSSLSPIRVSCTPHKLGVLSVPSSPRVQSPAWLSSAPSILAPPCGPLLSIDCRKSLE